MKRWIFPTSGSVGPLAQLVEQLTFNQRVGGSNPPRLTSRSSSLVQDTGLSRRRHGFESRTGRFERRRTILSIPGRLEFTKRCYIKVVPRLPAGLPITSCPVRLVWSRTPAFHAGDTGSNPVRDM